MSTTDSCTKESRNDEKSEEAPQQQQAPWRTLHPRVLSIQSHVVHGYVGNKAATFPLQLHGVEVDPLNVVHFSNHTGYKVFKGTRLDVEQFKAVIDGLRVNHLLPTYNIVLSGYVGNPEILGELALLVNEWKEKQQRRCYICDPVCGDNGKLYVSEAVLPIYREQLIPLATFVTPNGFEASVLSGINVVDVSSARAAANWFHDRGTSVVVIKSFHDKKWRQYFAADAPEVAEIPSGDEKHILLLVSERTERGESGGNAATGTNSAGRTVQRLMAIPEIELGYVSGTGDVFAALLIGHLTSYSRQIASAGSSGSSSSTDIAFSSSSTPQRSSLAFEAVRRAVGSIYEILHTTVHASPRDTTVAESRHGVMKELALVHNMDAILTPSQMDHFPSVTLLSEP